MGQREEGADIIPLNAERETEPMALPRLGETLAALRALASDLGVDQTRRNWPSDVVRAVCRLHSERRRTEAAHREDLRRVAAALAGKDPADVPGCFEVPIERLAVEAARAHEGLEVKDRLIAQASQTINDLRRELEATRIELAKARQ